MRVVGCTWWLWEWSVGRDETAVDEESEDSLVDEGVLSQTLDGLGSLEAHGADDGQKTHGGSRDAGLGASSWLHRDQLSPETMRSHQSSRPTDPS